MAKTPRTISIDDLQKAEALIKYALDLGVRSWHTIAALFSSAGFDEQTISDLKPKWDALYDDVKRAAEGR